jgi:hypothetical protein
MYIFSGNTVCSEKFRGASRRGQKNSRESRVLGCTICIFWRFADGRTGDYVWLIGFSTSTSKDNPHSTCLRHQWVRLRLPTQTDHSAPHSTLCPTALFVAAGMPVIPPSGGSSSGRYLVALASLAAGATLALGYRERLLVSFAVSSPAHTCDAYTCYWHGDVIFPISWPVGLRFCCFNSQCSPITGKLAKSLVWIPRNR